MKFDRFSKKQLRVFNWWTTGKYDALICDGAIRSGKTLSMSISFVIWAMHSFDGKVFAFCGKTIESLRRNVIVPLVEGLYGAYEVQENKSQNYLRVSVNGRVNTFYLFGGRDESSYMLIQGITLSGVLFDEVALMPRSFVEQALARCSVAGSKVLVQLQPGDSRPLVPARVDFEGKRKKRLALAFSHGG